MRLCGDEITQICTICCIILLFCIVFITKIEASRMIACEDFEDNNFSDFFHAAQSSYWDHLSITDYEPHSGNYSLRANACNSCTDPITGREGNNRTNLNFGYAESYALGSSFDLDSFHVNELYIKFWLKYDADFDPTDGYSSNKIWWMQFEPDTDTYYIQFRGNSLSYYDELGYTRETYVAVSPNAVDGIWHSFEIYVHYNDYGFSNGLLRVWFDGNEKITYSSAQFIISNGGKISRMCFGYFHNKAAISSGWQIDDIEIWDGIPEPGDVNGDGQVNISDVYLVVNVILGNAINSRADVNLDENTNISDVYEVVNEILTL